MNPYEELGRTRKCARLVIEIDCLAERLGVDTRALIPAVERWGDPEWTELAVAAGQKPPSEITRGAVIDLLRVRAERCGRIERLVS